MTGKALSSRDLSRLFPSTRYCAHHGGVALIEGGKWLVTNKGRCRRWICAGCNEKRRERLSMGQGQASRREESPSSSRSPPYIGNEGRREQ